MEVEEARRRFASSPVARLATVRPDGSPHVVPVVFALDGDRVHMAVDAKPKRTRNLQRVINLRADPRCALLVDHYGDDWSQLWWVRADGEARVIDDPREAEPGLALLADRHLAYAAERPAGPLLTVVVMRWSGWSASQ
jgi:PPOX class probable F420-dependent enzyme